MASVLVNHDINFTSPNAELLGSVVLLLYWCVLLYRRRISQSGLLLVVLGAITFHLKYQLFPQLIVLTFISGLKIRKACLLIIYIVISALVVDALVYRFNGMGFLGQIAHISSDYVSIENSSPLSVLRLLFSIFLFNNILTIYPFFLLAWVLLLDRVVRSRRTEFFPRLSRGLIPCLALSVVTLLAILIPQKNWSHYYLLLILTTVCVMNYALMSLNTEEMATALNQQDLKISPVVIIQPLAIFFAFVALLVGRSIAVKDNPYKEANNLMSPSDRQQGALVYGVTNEYTYGTYGTFPKNPLIDHAFGLYVISSHWKTGDEKGRNSFNQLMSDRRARPPFVIDIIAPGSKSPFTEQIDPIDKLQKGQDSPWAKSYELVRKTPSGWLYKLKD
jgi:hypothetical protein